MKARHRRGVASLRGAGTAVVLGSGLDGVCESFPCEGTLRFEDVRGLSPAGVPGHRGEFRRSRVHDRSFLFVRGRKHHYESGDREIRELVAFIHSLDVRDVIFTSAAGSLTPHITPGELVIADDIIDLQFRRPEGPHTPRPTGGALTERERGACRRDLRLDPELNGLLRRAAAVARVPLTGATLAGCAGPAYETAAEIIAIRRLGADAATMSLAPECCWANRYGLRVAALASISNLGTGISTEKLRHGEVLARGELGSGQLERLLIQFFKII
jgi:purine-nucleoside phosphorylase